MRRIRGFTLIELMIVVAIIAVLAAIAVPWWGQYTYRARRADGQKLLMHIAQVEERYYTDYNKYTIDPKDLGYTTDPVPSERGYYSVALSVPAGSSVGVAYIATATPLNAQAKDVCGALSIDSTGLKKPIATDTTHNSNGSCW
jgi:type IV pilus assembly protein PilE